MPAAIPAVILAALGAWWIWRRSSRPELRYFSAEEFGPYWSLMNADLLIALDEFRHRLGYPVGISPAPGSLGRPAIGSQVINPEEAASDSWHNWFKHGQVFAVDVMPRPPGGATPEERERWRRIAREVGFTGIGIYPDWKPRPGLHLDKRTDRQPGKPAEWAGVRVDGRQVYVNIERGLV